MINALHLCSYCGKGSFEDCEIGEPVIHNGRVHVEILNPEKDKPCTHCGELGSRPVVISNYYQNMVDLFSANLKLEKRIKTLEEKLNA